MRSTRRNSAINVPRTRPRQVAMAKPQKASHMVVRMLSPSTPVSISLASSDGMLEGRGSTYLLTMSVETSTWQPAITEAQSSRVKPRSERDRRLTFHHRTTRDDKAGARGANSVVRLSWVVMLNEPGSREGCCPYCPRAGDGCAV